VEQEEALDKVLLLCGAESVAATSAWRLAVGRHNESTSGRRECQQLIESLIFAGLFLQMSPVISG